MFSLMKIATLATIAFGALVSALPQPVASPDIKALVARQASAPDVTTVLTNLNNDLQGPVGQLNALTAATATPDKVQPIVLNIQVIISAAVDAAKGKPAGSGDLFVLLSVVINLVIGAFGKVINFPGVDKASLIVIFQLVDSVLAALIHLVLGLVGVVVALLVALLGGVVSIIIELNLTAVISVLLI
ncbi:hypothetical protein K488DRAFT_72586 [Vararia minispora EC-137]|uniref:Uncharacterized protein n=1 Tax=Vararia minispora EC-137 TaxID=1314806 RepID=A0ACB8QE74_9AGAM|nr:hypothetical protein K488DRAFT_72586 [Vararia minispora EC-137]